MVAYAREFHIRRICHLLMQPVTNAVVLLSYPQEEIEEAHAILVANGVIPEEAPKPWIPEEWKAELASEPEPEPQPEIEPRHWCRTCGSPVPPDFPDAYRTRKKRCPKKPTK